MTNTTGVSNILVPTDFLCTAMVALEWAIELARPWDARIHLVHAVPAKTLPYLSLRLQEQVSDNLERAETRVREAGIPVETASTAGDPATVILEAEQRVGADLIVLGATGRHAVTRLCGSTADRVVRRATAPVFTVHPWRERRKRRLDTLMLATDFSEGATLALETALDVVRPLPGPMRIVLLHVCSTASLERVALWGSAFASSLCDEEDEAHRRLAELASDLDTRAGRHVFELRVRCGMAAQVIEREARAAEADLVVLGTHGHTGLEHVLLGSVAEHVLHRSPCPVLTVRHPEALRPASGERAGAQDVLL